MIGPTGLETNHCTGFILPIPPNTSPWGLGLLIAVFAIVSVSAVVVFYAAQSSRPLLQGLETEPELEETTSEEKERKKTTE
ncbi:MAG: hypothetical protein WA672_11910 [Candidatus Angelobacter sp.]